ncbi:MAG: CDP-alcohol phosphatidyltransferase family protein [Bacilli bacterium]|nr:CDP-alcohol phosphatidyltransferase family protein [Bacilli bacterium]MDD4795805.1 CDP-alcohol phosphatidyltransferase family protein [Bacilli bacterium]
MKKFIGIYDYTVILTYLSLCSSVVGISLAFNGHSFFALICLMLSGLFDMFDGKVARTKKRNQREINYGIQIDSLADIIAFGVLPICIGFSLGIKSWYYLPICIAFTLGALIRLAYFNVNEEEVSKTTAGRSTSFIGLPTTSVALILPLVYMFKNWTNEYFQYIYTLALLIISVLFVLNANFIKKPTNKKMIWLIVVGILEVILILGIKAWLT